MLKDSANSQADFKFEVLGSRDAASYERELFQYRNSEARLRKALTQDKALLSQKDAQLRQQALFGRESNHRLLNDLQIVVSLLSLQSRAAGNAETASQLKTAADRVGTIARLHQRLHSHDSAQTVAFKAYLEELCRDFSAMTFANAEKVGLTFDNRDEVGLPAAIGVSLGFLVSELLTNAAKHGKSRIAVRFEAGRDGGYELSVSNDGQPLPESFDPAACKGLGMKIIKSFVDRIGGRLRFGRGDGDQGACFVVDFACKPPV